MGDTSHTSPGQVHLGCGATRKGRFVNLLGGPNPLMTDSLMNVVYDMNGINGPNTL